MMLKRHHAEAEERMAEQKYHICYKNDDEAFRSISKIKCIIKHFPDKGEYVYAVKRIHSDGHAESPKKAILVPTWKFVLMRYWFLAVAIAIVGFVCLIAMPKTVLFALSVFYGYYKIFTPFKNHATLQRTNGLFILLFLSALAIVTYLLFVGDTVGAYRGVEISQGIVYSLMLGYALFFFVGLFNKYKRVYALGINKPNEWKFASFFIWENGIAGAGAGR